MTLNDPSQFADRFARRGLAVLPEMRMTPAKIGARVLDNNQMGRSRPSRSSHESDLWRFYTIFLCVPAHFGFGNHFDARSLRTRVIR